MRGGTGPDKQVGQQSVRAHKRGRQGCRAKGHLRSLGHCVESLVYGQEVWSEGSSRLQARPGLQSSFGRPHRTLAVAGPSGSSTRRSWGLEMATHLACGWASAMVAEVRRRGRSPASARTPQATQPGAMGISTENRLQQRCGRLRKRQ